MIPRLHLPCYFYRLRSLLLDYNTIGDKGAVALSCALMGNATLTLLRCESTGSDRVPVVT
jgi:hypothetical protein